MSWHEQFIDPPNADTVHIIAIPSDNYCYCIQRGYSAIIIDPGIAGPVIQFLDQRELTLGAIFLTHHHGDHTGGAAKFAKQRRVPIIGPDDRRCGCTQNLADNENVTIDGIVMRAIATPGHTRSHMCYYAPGYQALFTGDTMFYAGCGRLFEGTAAQMKGTLMRLATFPDETLVYCGHEYTEENLAFAQLAEPDNDTIAAAIQQVADQRKSGKPSIPSTIGQEKRVNPFLRAPDEKTFAALRKRKDRF